MNIAEQNSHVTNGPSPTAGCSFALAKILKENIIFVLLSHIFHAFHIVSHSFYFLSFFLLKLKSSLSVSCPCPLPRDCISPLTLVCLLVLCLLSSPEKQFIKNPKTIRQNYNKALYRDHMLKLENNHHYHLNACTVDTDNNMLNFKCIHTAV